MGKHLGMTRGRRRTAVAAAAVLGVVAVAGTAAFAVGRGDDARPAGPGPATTAASSADVTPADGAGPPVKVCGDKKVLDGPAEAPAGAVTVPAGDNASLQEGFSAPGKTFWFAPGVHTLAGGEYSQIRPGDGSRFIGAPGAILDGRTSNLYAFAGTAKDVTIEHLTIRNFGTGASNNDQGVINLDRGDGWTVQKNTVTANDGAGVMLGSGGVLSRNCLQTNGQYGFSAFPAQGRDTVTGLKVVGNEITGNNTDDWEKRREGCGCTGGGKFWQVDGAEVTGNNVHDNRGAGLWADNDNRQLLFRDNYFTANDGVGLELEVSYNFSVRENVFTRNALVQGKAAASGGDAFPAGAIYVSESGGDRRAGARYATADITGNTFTDNWDGVVLWENADRFCRPGEEFDTTNGCPWFEQKFGTRYKTQNVRITGNEFRVDKKKIGCTRFCGRQAIFSNYGTYPDNSPYKGTLIQQAITFDQRNVWADNTYTGDWSFMAYEVSRELTFAQWQAGPYNQDKGSTSSG